MDGRDLIDPPGWTLATQSIEAEQLRASLEILHGRVPDGLRGTFYRNGPARHALGSQRYHHWFDGDGMVQAFHFTDAGVEHYGRYVETHKHAAERAAGEFLYPAFGTDVPKARESHPDARNPANTKVLAHHGRLLALWEGGSAHSLDPEHLETEGPVVWSDETAGLPFSAHPKVEPDGTLWNFGMRVTTGELVLYKVGPDGCLDSADNVPLSGLRPMVHDFAVTRRWLVFLLPPLHFEPDRFYAGHCFLDCHRWVPEQPMRVLVVDKDDFAHRHWFELPAGFVFHLGGAWDDGDCVRLDYDRHYTPDIVTTAAREIMRGGPVGGMSAEATQVSLDLRRGTARQEGFAARGEFPALHPNWVGRRYRYRYGVADTESASHPFQNAIRRIDLESGRVQIYKFGPDAIAEEHVVVPKPAGRGEADAWLVGTALDVAARRTRLTVFDAAAVNSGPVLEAALPYALPLGLHGDFAAA